MNVSRNGLIALARHEAVVLSTYKDSVGVLAIGVGHTAAGDPQPTKGLTLTPAEAIDLFRRDLAKYERHVAEAVKVRSRRTSSTRWSRSTSTPARSRARAW